MLLGLGEEEQARLSDLGVQALAHLHATVCHEHRAICVYIHQRASLQQNVFVSFAENERVSSWQALSQSSVELQGSLEVKLHRTLLLPARPARKRTTATFQPKICIALQSLP